MQQIYNNLKELVKEYFKIRETSNNTFCPLSEEQKKLSILLDESKFNESKLYPLNYWILHKSPLSYDLSAMIISLIPMILYFTLWKPQPINVIFDFTQWKSETSNIIFVILLTLITFLGFAFVIYGYKILKENRNTIFRLLKIKECKAMQERMKLIFDPINQLIFCLLFYLLFLVVISFDCSIQIVLIDRFLFIWCEFTFGILIGNGVYWALATPKFIYIICASEKLQYDLLSPAETPGIKTLSSMLGTYALMNTIVISLIALAFLPGSGTVLISIYAIGVTACLLYSFFYPQILLTRLVKNLKNETEYELILYQNNLLHKNTILYKEDISQIFKLLDRVRSSKDSPLVMSVIFKYISAVIPLLTGFGKLIF
ncbi:membrane hypothetical protein [Candidatus Magnetomoraceae bacterium gMMP-15]